MQGNVSQFTRSVIAFMAFYLYILRHAKSDWSVASRSDFDRPINKRGRKNSKLLGQWMDEHEHYPDMIISSPAVRAKETAERITQQLQACDKDAVHYDNNLYLADVDTLLEKITLYKYGVNSLLLIGHNPGLDQLVELLANGIALNRKEGKLMTTATLCLMKFNNQDFAAGVDTPEKIRIIRPTDLI